MNSIIPNVFFILKKYLLLLSFTNVISFLKDKVYIVLFFVAIVCTKNNKAINKNTADNIILMLLMLKRHDMQSKLI